jgi:hypothetical protein
MMTEDLLDFEVQVSTSLNETTGEPNFETVWKASDSDKGDAQIDTWRQIFPKIFNVHVATWYNKADNHDAADDNQTHSHHEKQY